MRETLIIAAGVFLGEALFELVRAGLFFSLRAL